MTLPGGNGAELALAVLNAYPSLSILLCGALEQATDWRKVDPNVFRIARKPHRTMLMLAILHRKPTSKTHHSPKRV